MKLNLFNGVFYIAAFILTSFLLSGNVMAGYLYVEDFDSTSYSHPLDWEQDKYSGQINFSGSSLQLLRNVSKTNSFPYVRTVNNIIPATGSFMIDLSYSYINAGNFGDGIAISPDPAPYGTSTIHSDHKKHISFLIWQDSPLGLRIYTTMCSEINPTCNNSLTQIYSDGVNFSAQNLLLKYDAVEDKYSLFINNDATPIFTSFINQNRPVGLWMGYGMNTNTTDYWSAFEIDYVRIESLEAEPEENTPVVVIPGMGASWDYDAMLAGTPGSNWHIPSFIPVYSNLIDSLVNAGYTENTDLFIFPYDWRKNLTDLGNDLDVFINSKIAADKKINFVSHSMGGLVARAWANNHTDRINKIVTAGTPHKGATDAYSAWEGATLFERAWWLRAPFELIVELNRQPAETNVAAVRRLMPSFSNLLPVYDYLNDGSPLAWNSLSQVNPVLGTWNTTSLDSLLWALAGKGHDTKGQLLVAERDWLDRVMGRWEDGKPTGVTPVGGDRTVILSSALGGFSSAQELDSTNHGQVIGSQVALEAIFDQLGLDKSKIITNSSFDLVKKVFVASLRSPGNLQVCNSSNVCNDDLGILIEDEDLFFLPGYNGEDLQVKVIGDAEGSYHLYLGRLEEEESKWQKFLGDTSVGEEDIFEVSNAGGEMMVEDEQVVILTGRKLTNAYSSLIRKIRQDYKAMNWQAMEDNIDSWKELDRMAAMGKVQTSYVNRKRRLVEIYGQRTSAKLANSQSYYAGVLFEMGQNNTQTAKTKETLTSAENLFKLAGLLK